MKKIIFALALIFIFCASARAQSPSLTTYTDHVLQPSAPGSPSVTRSVAFSGAGLNDLTSAGTYTANDTTSFVITIAAAGTPDTFDWTQDGAGGASGVAITGAAQTLADGITITFAATTGHTATNNWTITIRPRARSYFDNAGVFKLKDNLGAVSTYLTGAGAVTSLTGTASQVSVSGSVGAVTISLPSTVTVATGYQIGGAAASAEYLRGNGTTFVSSAIQPADYPAFVGDSGSGGARGAVPAPAAGDAAAVKFLSADGTWATVAAGGTAWNGITDPTGNLALSMAGRISTFTYGATTGASTDLFKLTDATNNTGTGYFLTLTAASGSVIKGIKSTTNGALAGTFTNTSTTIEAVQINNAQATVASPLLTLGNGTNPHVIFQRGSTAGSDANAFMMDVRNPGAAGTSFGKIFYNNSGTTVFGFDSAGAARAGIYYNGTLRLYADTTNTVVTLDSATVPALDVRQANGGANAPVATFSNSGGTPRIRIKATSFAGSDANATEIEFVNPGDSNIYGQVFYSNNSGGRFGLDSATAPLIELRVGGTVYASLNTTVFAVTGDVSASGAFLGDYNTATAGNDFTDEDEIYKPSAGRAAATNYAHWNALNTGGAVLGGADGTNDVKARFEFAAAGTTGALFDHRLPTGWTGAVDVSIIWSPSNTNAGNVVWSISCACGTGNDPTQNTASTVTTASTASTSTETVSAVTNITTTGCAAGERIHVQIQRLGDDAADTANTVAHVVGATLTLRRVK